RDVPILLSVGYSACHWCHVMARESFEDADTAAVMNEHFVNIKVDREERPDVDAVYLAATTALTGQGGWPMTVFLDHDRHAFYAGTYFPPQPRGGSPSFRMVLTAIAAAWTERRPEIEQAAQRIVRHLRQEPVDPRALTAELSDHALAVLVRDFDDVDGGFGRAPKFPQPMVHEWLLRRYARTGDRAALEMVELTLTRMAQGGLYDQLAGGFARYSVDAHWLVPHFEKMLYDNALLMRVYLHWWRATGSQPARRVVSDTAQFLLDELRTPEGCFAASLDADTEAGEGAFYVWTPAQVVAAGGDPRVLGVSEQGNFEPGTSVLSLTGPPDPDWPRMRAAMRAARAQRPQPARDDKVVLAWNAWAVAALAEAGALLGQSDWIEAAVACRDRLWQVHRGRPWRRVSRDGVPGTALAVLEDLGALAMAEFTLAAVTGGRADAGLELVADLRRSFLAADRDGQAADVPTIAPDLTDNATPSGWSLAAEALLTASAYTGDQGLREEAEDLLARAGHLADHPQFWGHGLGVLEAMLDGPREVAVIAAPGSAMHRTALRGTAPGAVIALAGPLCEARPRVAGQDTAYVCRHFVCDTPVTDPRMLAEQIQARAAALGSD
ncbi:MAG TPA: thioredoxin domain-containing protein, partial [Actinomycetota bacterium]|nr:thioredoxin domain-containing protein [Actinomycetota bacterium]